MRCTARHVGLCLGVFSLPLWEHKAEVPHVPRPDVLLGFACSGFGHHVGTMSGCWHGGDRLGSNAALVGSDNGVVFSDTSAVVVLDLTTRRDQWTTARAAAFRQTTAPLKTACGNSAARGMAHK